MLVVNDMRHRIIRCLNKSNESQYKSGKDWYRKANGICRDIAEELDYSLDVVVKVLALLSPNNKWERNVIDTKSILSAYKEGKSLEDIKVCTYKSNKDKAIKVIKGESSIVTGRKVSSFYENIMYPDTSNKVTVDRWIMRIVDKKDKSPTPSEYDSIENEFRIVGGYTRLRPSELQAICWSVVRSNNLNTSNS